MTETRDHKFFECSYSKEVWYGIIKDIAGDRRSYQWNSVIQGVVNDPNGRVKTFLLRYCFQSVAHALWQERNRRRVGESSQPPSCLIAKLDKLIRNRITSIRRRDGGKHEANGGAK